MGEVALLEKALGEQGVARNVFGFWGKAPFRPWALPAGLGQAEPLGNKLAYLELLRRRFALNPNTLRAKTCPSITVLLTTVAYRLHKR